MKKRDFENVMAGCFLSLCAAMPERIDCVTAILDNMAADPRATDYERGFYRDLADCAAMMTLPPHNYDFSDDLLLPVH